MSNYPIKLASIILTVKSAHSIFRQILAHKISANILTDKYRKCFEQIYHGRNIAVERRSNFPRRNGEWNFVSRLESFTNTNKLITPNIHLYLDVCVYIKKYFLWVFGVPHRSDRMQRNVCLPYLLQNVHVTSSDRQKKKWENRIKFGEKWHARVIKRNPKMQIPRCRG
jgi:hypothetical protein